MKSSLFLMKFISKALISRLAIAIFVLMVMASAFARAGEIRVSPSKLDFTSDAKSGAISVLNEGSRRFVLRISATAWHQNIEGTDIQTETTDIVFYPKNIILEEGGQQVIRIGTKGFPSSREKAYRIIIEEIFTPKDGILKEHEERNNVIGLRSIVPIFVKPRVEQFSGEIEKFVLSGGEVSVTVRNTGNVHVTITSVSVHGTAPDGREIFSREIAGWYLLNGASRAYKTEIARDVCRGLARMYIEVKSDKYSLKGGMEVRKEMCSL